MNCVRFSRLLFYGVQNPCRNIPQPFKTYCHFVYVEWALGTVPWWSRRCWFLVGLRMLSPSGPQGAVQNSAEVKRLWCHFLHVHRGVCQGRSNPWRFYRIRRRWERHQKEYQDTIGLQCWYWKDWKLVTSKIYHLILSSIVCLQMFVSIFKTFLSSKIRRIISCDAWCYLWHSWSI